MSIRPPSYSPIVVIILLDLLPGRRETVRLGRPALEGLFGLARGDAHHVVECNRAGTMPRLGADTP